MDSKPWLDETKKVLNEVVEYGYFVKDSSIPAIFMHELGLNHRYPQPRGQSIRNEVVGYVYNHLREHGYSLSRGTWVPPNNQFRSVIFSGESQRFDFNSLQDLPTFANAHSLWQRVNYFALSKPEVSYARHFADDPKKLFSGLDFNGQSVIEFGPGYHPQLETLLSLGAVSYAGVDPFVTGPTSSKIRELEQSGKINGTQASVVKKDSLTYLLDCEDNSGVVIAFYVQAVEMLKNMLLNLQPEHVVRRHHAFSERYKDDLAKNLFRVTRPGGFVFHHHAYDPDQWDQRYLDLGFSKSGSGLFIKKH